MADEASLADWEEYQQGFHFAPEFCFTAFSAFSNDSTRLFIKDPNKLSVEIWESQQQRATPLALNTILRSSNELKEFITRTQQDNGIVALNIPQATSWSRLKISFSMFAHLCSVLKIAPSFLEITSTFGFRREDSDNFFNSSLWRAVPSSTSKLGTKAYDICYNIRYVDLHNRVRAEPWTYRNFAIYHRYYNSEKFIWLYINLPETLKAQITYTVDKKSSQGGHASLLHLSFLRFSLVKWRFYINYLEVKVLDISKAVAFVRLENRTGVDFELDFSSGQKLSVLRQSIERSINIIHSYRGIAETLQEVSSAMSRQNCMSVEEAEDMFQGTKELLRTADVFTKKLEAMMRSCHFTSELLFQFLGSRNNAAMYKTTSILKTTMEASTAETRNIAWLNRQSCADSRGAKITARISMVYVPASLIAGIFSSGLIKARPDVSGSVLVVIFILTIIMLTAVTLTINWYFEKQQIRDFNSKQRDAATSSLSHLGV